VLLDSHPRLLAQMPVAQPNSLHSTYNISPNNFIFLVAS